MKILGFEITRRNNENPNDPITFDDDSGGTSNSGVVVSEDSSMGVASVWRGVSLISRDVAKMPLHAYERTSDGGKNRATGESIYSLLRYKPNPVMNAFNFKQFIQSRALLTGNGYAFIERNNAGKVLALWPLNDYRVCPILIDGDLSYELSDDSGKVSEIIPARNMFHLRGIGDRIQGYSLISYAQETIGLSIATQKYTSMYFSNGAKPQIILQHPANLSDEAATRLRRSFGKRHQGIDNAFKTAILEEGMTLATVAINNREAQLEELVKLTQKEVAQFLNIPLGKLGESESVSYNSAEQENQSYLDNALDPWLVAWESECYDKLLSKSQKDKDSVFFEFLRTALVRMNATDRAALYTSGLQWGWLLRDEVRSAENMNPLPDGEGKKAYIPANMVIVGEDNNENNDSDSANNDATREAARVVLCDALRRVAGRWKSKDDAAQRKGQAYDPELRFFDEIIETPYALYKTLSNVEPYAQMRDRLAHDFRNGLVMADLADLALFLDNKKETEQE